MGEFAPAWRQTATVLPSSEGGGAAAIHGLQGASATLFVALAARALAASGAPELGFADRHAEQILERLRIDPRRFKLSANLVRVAVLRSRWFAQTIGRFLARNPQGLCINAGCGLGATFEQVVEAGGNRFDWIDLDLPQVIAIRRRFFVDTARRRMIEGDLSDPTLFARIPWAPRQPALIAAEGVLYYLPAAQVREFFCSAAKATDARGAQLEVALDYTSRVGAWLVCRQPAHRQLGTSCSWTLRRAADLRLIDPRLEVTEDADVFVDAMPPGGRQVTAIFRFTTGGGLGSCAHLRRAPANGSRA